MLEQDASQPDQPKDTSETERMRMRFREILTKGFRRIIQFLDYIWPKDSTILIFGSRGGSYPSGNSKALFEYIAHREGHPFRCYFFLNHHTDSPYERCIRRPSLGTVHLFLRAKTILMTNSLGDMGNLRPSKRKYVIHLWHGHGPKADGYASKKFTREMLQDSEHWMQYTTAFLTCSRLDSYMRAYAHALHPTQILSLGYPRCDYLLDESRWKEKIPTLYASLPEYDKVLLYATTWRTEGTVRFFPFEDFTTDALEEWCAGKRILMLIRSHEGDGGEVKETHHIRNLPYALQPDIAEVLPEVDLLINDYSSIQSDFMLLDRPMIFVPYDLDDFLERESLCYPDYDFWCPGEKVYTFTVFQRAIEKALWESDEYAEQRRQVNRLINEYQKPGASERVYEYLLQLLGFR